jgi:2-polyprenyl-3-methyl-5-hydroxy-6-metoxy-1,4-benzoquinol methylase
MRSTLSCILCDHEWSVQTQPPRIEACPGCGVPTNVPPPARDVFSDELFFEGAYGGVRLAKTEQWLHEARLRLAWVQSHVPRGRLLEIGSATGEFAHTAERAGYAVVGLEASAWAVEASRRLTQVVERADLKEWLEERPDARFDAVVFFHTLEHVSEPRQFLAPLVPALAPGGRMFIEVPNGEARDLRDGAGWLGARMPDHVVHYRRQDLEQLLATVGMRVVQAETLTMQPFDSRLVWALRRLRWLSKGRLRPSRDFLRVVAAHATETAGEG